jgi:MFS family permease
MYLGLLLALVGALTIGLSVASSSGWLFLVGQTIFGLGIGACQQLRLAAADMFPPARRAEGLGYVLMGSLVGAVFGPVLIGVSQANAARFGLDPMALAWLLVPFIILPGLALVVQVRPDPREIAAHLDRYYPDQAPAPPPVRGAAGEVNIWTFLRHYPKRTAFAANTAVYANMTTMMAMTGLALDHHGHDLTAISIAVSTHAVGMFGLSLPLGRLADTIGRRNVLLWGLVAAATGSLLISLSAIYAVVTLGTFLVGLGWSCGNVAGTALIADTTTPLLRGRAVGTNDTIGGLASILLPVLAGPLVAVAGLESLAILSLAILVVPIMLLIRLVETSPGQYADQPG